ncbi:hypothetical protein C1H46_006641 [Malus baccata]|uniref:Uncharacterized protein n=1 Tax=Malus baccata TaxID=106549 RepID=A0A540N9I3_MALBA|nr:hypothetical protein C1H46_006641 [Malus baccata]
MFVKKKMNRFLPLQLLALVLIFSSVATQVVPQDHETKGSSSYLGSSPSIIHIIFL